MMCWCSVAASTANPGWIRVNPSRSLHDVWPFRPRIPFVLPGLQGTRCKPSRSQPFCSSSSSRLSSRLRSRGLSLNQPTLQHCSSRPSCSSCSSSSRCKCYSSTPADKDSLTRYNLDQIAPLLQTLPLRLGQGTF